MHESRCPGRRRRLLVALLPIVSLAATHAIAADGPAPTPEVRASRMGGQARCLSQS